MEFVTLNNGVKMPIVGYGVFLVTPEECEQCVRDAIEVGYRSIDTAQGYRNEEGVGNAIAGCGVPREELFITTKVSIPNAASREKAAASIDESLKKLRTDYVDLFLVHQPFNDYYGAYRALEDAYKAGKVRAIGVSNFYPDRFVDIATFSEVKPAVNQVEAHVFNQQRVAQDYMKKYNCQIEAWGPMARGENGLFKNETLTAIGADHGKSAAQVALRFLVQKGIVVIPKSVHKARMQENIDIFDFTLSDVEMEHIEGMDLGGSVFCDHYDPAFVEHFLAKNLGKK